MMAIWEIEQDPGWKPPFRYLAPPSSRHSGCIADFTVDGFVIFYRVVDHGAAFEVDAIFPLDRIGPALDPP